MPSFSNSKNDFFGIAQQQHFFMNFQFVERVIPTDGIQIMFHYKTPFIVLHQNQKNEHQSRSIISGLSHSYANVKTNGTSGVIFINFYPLGASYFFNFPLTEIENRNINLREIYQKEITEVEELLYIKNSIQERVKVIEAFLTKRFHPIANHDQLLIGKGLELIKNQKGVIHTQSLCDILHTTPKTLERKFSYYLGKPTKQMIKLIRFHDVLSDLKSSKMIHLSEFAYQKGFYDQSHFIRDFKSYTGYTPKQFYQKYLDYKME